MKAVKLTFFKDFEAVGAAGMDKASLMACTTDGEPIDKVISCSVSNEVGALPKMTLVVYVDEHISDVVAARMKERLKS
jgi:hypothetical protein